MKVKKITSNYIIEYEDVWVNLEIMFDAKKYKIFPFNSDMFNFKNGTIDTYKKISAILKCIEKANDIAIDKLKKKESE